MFKYEFKTALPFCLNLKDDNYIIKHESREYLFRTSKIWSKFASNSDLIDDYEDNPERKPIAVTFKAPVFSDSISDFTGSYTGKNIQFIDDDTDHFRLTVLQIFWDSEKDYLSEKKKEENSQKIKTFNELLKVVNSFIETYRFVSGQFYLPLLKEIPFRNFATLKNIETGEARGLFSILVKKASYNISKDKHDSFKKYLVDESFINSTLLSLNSSKHWLARSQFRNSILDSIISLEPVVYRIIKKVWLERGISRNRINAQLSKVDLNYLMTIEIPNLIDTQEESIKSIYENVLKAITLRNNIVHKNFNDISVKDAENTLDNVEKLIIILNNCETKINKP